jgi:hypothetical protein
MTDEMLRVAFATFVQRLRSASALEGSAWASYERQMAAAFEENRHVATATAQFNGDWYLLESTCTYVGYPGDSQLVVEFARGTANDVLGRSVRDVLSASKRMMYEYLTGAQPALERAEGIAHRVRRLEEALQRLGYKTKRALLKSMNLVYIQQDDREGSIVFRPSAHVSLEGYEGLDSASSVSVSLQASVGEVGTALRLALSRCIG